MITINTSIYPTLLLCLYILVTLPCWNTLLLHILLRMALQWSSYYLSHGGHMHSRRMLPRRHWPCSIMMRSCIWWGGSIRHVGCSMASMSCWYERRWYSYRWGYRCRITRSCYGWSVGWWYSTRRISPSHSCWCWRIWQRDRTRPDGSAAESRPYCWIRHAGSYGWRVSSSLHSRWDAL